MGNTCPESLAAEILERCLRGQSPPADLAGQLAAQAADRDPLIARNASRALFRGVVEALADRFEPEMCHAYAVLFSHVIAAATGEFEPAGLVSRYERLRRFRRFDGSSGPVREVYVLSRVTLGADVAITSVVLDAAKKRFPAAEVFLVGSRKCWALFEGDPRIRHFPADYRRDGTLTERLAAGLGLRSALSRAGGIVIDPDSRITQLGLLPVCGEEHYYFFDSRAAGGSGGESLCELTQRWVAEVFGVVDAVPYIAPKESGTRPEFLGISVSFGVGDNEAKRLPDPFEKYLLHGLTRRGLPVLIDRGLGGEEAKRVDTAVSHAGSGAGNLETWDGAFAPFAHRISTSRLYAGYDSAGQHVAAACRVPLVSVFAGFVNDRMFARWRPTGAGPIVIVRVDRPDPAEVLARTMAAVDTLLGVDHTRQ